MCCAVPYQTTDQIAGYLLISGLSPVCICMRSFVTFHYRSHCMPSAISTILWLDYQCMSLLGICCNQVHPSVIKFSIFGTSWDKCPMMLTNWELACLLDEWDKCMDPDCGFIRLLLPISHFLSWVKFEWFEWYWTKVKDISSAIYWSIDIRCHVMFR